LLISTPGTLGGVGVGLLAPFLLLSGELAVPFADYLESVLAIAMSGCALGILSGLLYSLGPLWGTRTIAPGSLLRAVHWSGDMRFLHWKWRWGLPVSGALGCALLLAWQNGWRVGVLFAAELAIIPAFLWLLAMGARASLRRLSPANLTVRLAVRGVIAPGADFMGTVISLGLGAGVVCAILFLEQNLHRQMVSRLPQRIPGFFLIDLHSDQEAPLRSWAEPFLREPKDLQTTPVVRGRIQSLQGMRVTPEWVAGHPQAWRFSRDYVLTWSQELPPGNRLTAGRWWSGSHVHEASVEQEMARALGLKIGDEISFDILGVEVAARVSSLREVQWSDMGLNFFVVFSPAVLQGAPFSWLGSVVVEPSREEEFRAALVRRFPNVSTLAVREVMEAAQAMLARLIDSVRLAGAMAAMAGLTALGVTVTLTRRRRAREAAIRRLLGATRGELARTALVEYLLLGVIASLAGVAVGHGVTGGVTWLLFKDVWEWSPLWTLATWGGGVLLIALVGFVTARGELAAPVMAALRGHD
ncbi:MAG: FtsX-like permease family protein, partial [Magnetococcales bacterium]|nr:FtsX-like permease family protein [Magnetococcales bacterium]